MRPLIIIPSRLASTRLPRKALADIGGKPMIRHVAEQAVKADLGPVLIAAGDQEIRDVVSDIKGVTALLTEPDLPSGSDRIYRALLEYDPKAAYDVIVNLQGDLPLIAPSLIEKVLLALEGGDGQNFDLGTLVTPLRTRCEKEACSLVKAVCSFAEDKARLVGRALYFSRAPLPWGNDEGWHHIGLYGWRRDSLEKFVSLPPSPLEKIEKLEQLRALEAGMRIGCIPVEEAPLGVDVQSDLEKVREIYRGGR